MFSTLAGLIIGGMANSHMNDSNNEAMVRMNDSNNEAMVRMNDSNNLAATAAVGIVAAAVGYGIKKAFESDNSGKALNGHSNNPRLKSGN